MKFGPVAVVDAAGTILAHSVALSGGRLRKGVFLDDNHLNMLQKEGFDTVVVARLEAGDLHEDAAAQRLAAALVGEPGGLNLSDPFTGRVNLIAQYPGVARLNVAALNAANDVDPMITVATVPAWQQMAAGQMVATIKIISYGVPEAAVTRAAEAARGAISLMPPVFSTVSLIVTRLGNKNENKGVEAVLQRVEALGMRPIETLPCRHDEPALAETITKAAGDIVLILTASATSDDRDTAPAALRRAGGQVERFGMPVDPGNLLFLGDIKGRPVIGLPGCARSPALNGTDWVLSRVACGIEVTSADIAAMGVGGLLKEIPTRPMPRRGKSRRAKTGES